MRNYWQWGFTSRTRIQSLIKKRLVLHRVHRREDLERLTALAGYEREYRFNYPIEWKETLMLDESVKTIIAHTLSTPDRHLYPLGYVVLKERQDAFCTQPACTQLISIAVHPEYRRLGIASKMLWEAIKDIEHGNFVVTCLEDDLESLQFFRTFHFNRATPSHMTVVVPGKFTAQRKPAITLEMLKPQDTWAVRYAARFLRA